MGVILRASKFLLYSCFLTVTGQGQCARYTVCSGLKVEGFQGVEFTFQGSGIARRTLHFRRRHAAPYLRPRRLIRCILPKQRCRLGVSDFDFVMVQ